MITLRASLRRDSSGMPAKGLGASRGTAREIRGAVAGAGVRVARCGPGPGITGRARRGGCAKASEEGQGGGCRRGVRPVAGRGAGGRASAPGGGGRAPAGPRGAGARAGVRRVLLEGRSEGSSGGCGPPAAG